MFFQLSSTKIKKMALLVLIFISGIVGFLYLNQRFEINKAAQLYASKFKKDSSYWISHKLAEAVNPKEPSFFLWKVAGYSENENNANGSVKKAKSVPVLAYHGLPNEGIGQIPNDIFIEQLKNLKENGWNTIPLEDFKLFLKGEVELPEKSFLLTFDDGRKDAFYPADPVLRDLGFNAVIFVISKRSLSGEESSYYLSPYELKQLEKTGRWDIQSHGRDSHDWYHIDDSETLGHYFSDKLWIPEESREETDEEYRDRIIYDLTASKRELESNLNKKVTAVAYPFGDFGQDSLKYPESTNIVKTESPKIYELGFYQARRGIVETFNYPESQFMVRRIEPTAAWSGRDLLAVLDAGMAKELPYTAQSFGIEWRSSWGHLETGDSLSLKAAEGTTGSSAVLNGSYLWQDYLFSTDVDWQEGSNVVLVARHNDDNDYFGCNFGPKDISIKSSLQGVPRNIMKADYSPGPLPRSISLGIEVIGNDVSCLVNGEKLISGAGINRSNSNGSIGIEVWDANKGKARANFDNISVIGY